MQRAARWLVISILVTACQAGPPPSSSAATATASPTPSVASPTPTTVASPTPTPSPTSAPLQPPTKGIAVGRVVVTTVDRLSLREGPGTDANRIALLSVGTVGYVIDGPTSIDGWLWYRLSGMGLPFGTGCLAPPPEGTWSCPAFAGWVRMAGDDGQAWLAPTEVDCPRTTLQSITAVGYTYRLVCWKRNDISFDAWWPELPDDAGLGGACATGAPGGFLYCQNINYNGLTVAPRDGFGEQRLFLSIDPATDVEMPKRGQWIRVTGAFDHPAAAACADLAEGDEDPAIVVLRCRLQFVPSEVVPLGMEH